MKKLATLILIFTVCWSGVFAQDQEELFAQLELETSQTPLLPKRMIFTQRILWGENGLMRASKKFELSKESREQELKIRRQMLKAHQLIGYATLAGMVAQGVIGGKLYNGRYDLKDTHETIGNLTTATYFTGAALALFAPPPLINKKVKGFSSTKLHKTMATIHMSAMIATNLLAEEDKSAHRAAAYTLFGSYAVAVLSFKF